MELEWDEAKRENNLRKHGLDFRDAAQVLEGYTLELEDDREDYGEFRYLAVGLLRFTVVVLVYTPRENIYRIISMRKADNDEENFYRQSF